MPQVTTRMPQKTAATAAVILLVASSSTLIPSHVLAFQPSCKRCHAAVKSTSTTTALYASTPPPDDALPPKDDDSGDDDGLGDFLNPKPESENLRKAREFVSESSLPISFDDNDEIDEEFEAEVQSLMEEIDEENLKSTTNKEKDPSSALVNINQRNPATTSALFSGGQPSAAVLAKNPYLQVVSKLSPSELIAKFTATANPRVQEAVRSTILGLIGSLPKMAFDTTTITTGQRLASLMFQLQMTGYMFKNAEYRLSLSQSLGMANGSVAPSNRLLKGDVVAPMENDDDEPDPLVSGKIKGKLKIRFGRAKKDDQEELEAQKEETGAAEAAGGPEIEVDAAAYMSELRSEVSKLKEELSETRESKEEALRKDLLLYIRTLPAKELQSLTNTMSQDVLVCMKGLVGAVLGGIGEGQIGPDTVTEQSGEAMAQLCMWQLAVGYNLRELEVREELKQNLQSILKESRGGIADDDDDGEESKAFE